MTCGATADDERLADQFLAQHQPSIDLSSKYAGGRLMEPGRALSIYRMGAVGRAVQQAKYVRGDVTPELVASARRALDREPLADVRFSAVVSLPSRKALGPGFAQAIAVMLGVRWVELAKNRQTEEQKQFRSELKKRRNIKDALALPRGVAVTGSVLLVDDLWDSGETIKEAARTLHDAAQMAGGTCRVHPLVLAKTRDAKDES